MVISKGGNNVELREQIIQIANLLLDSRYCVILTGAGISTESGIPDFRSAGKGLWETTDPMEALSTRTLQKNPEILYNLCFKMFEAGETAQPNQAHEVLTKLQEKGLIKTIITQNIDNLHQRAGSRGVLEIHGSLQKGVCRKCGSKESTLNLITKVREEKEMPPRCQCGGILKPDITLFGESLPRDFILAQQEASGADLMIVIGSSLVVSPANYLPSLCPNLVIINKGSTHFDSTARVAVHEKAGPIMAMIWEEIKKRLA